MARVTLSVVVMVEWLVAACSALMRLADGKSEDGIEDTNPKPMTAPKRRHTKKNLLRKVSRSRVGDGSCCQADMEITILIQFKKKRRKVDRIRCRMR